jgi:hypothetical protein
MVATLDSNCKIRIDYLPTIIFYNVPFNVRRHTVRFKLFANSAELVNILVIMQS